ncbi:MAG TPA: dihydroorotate dehydrogenase [Candidatus Cloacimonetes bacterium]|nr:dihydroorotate dehydrogenase [Candidatus Cloacimonadota bacterium]HEX37954.1 dihydroorotate dehydrogenase [Candidatus Cloacimonadota bacterium]
MNKCEIQFGKMKWKNPLTVASGTFGLEYAELFDLSLLGALTTKTITPKPKKGNKPQRIVETEVGLLNSIGLQNPGLEEFIKTDLQKYQEFDTNLIVSISASTIDEFIKMIERLDIQTGIDAYEINVSCPNVENEGIAFGTNEEIVFELTRKITSVTEKTVIIKLTPNVTSIENIALAAQKGGADGLALINTLYGMAIDVDARKLKLRNGIGGYSGPGIKPIALQNVYRVAQVVAIPILAMGGISNVQDALEFVIAGATAVAVGTQNFVNPFTSIEVIRGLEVYCHQHSVDFNELIGSIT